jgi:surface antigen
MRKTRGGGSDALTVRLTIPRRRTASVLAGLLFVATVATFVTVTGAEAATGTVYVRGTVTCPEGQPFVGAWVDNSTGQSGFASKTILPGTKGRMARIGRTLSSVTVPTTVKINVGCGGSTSSWGYVFNGLGNVRATGTGTVFINVGCTTLSCTSAPKGTGGIATNPATESDPRTLYGKEWCTYRASEFWKQMTGSYPGWGGDAGYWDDLDRAQRLGWGVRSWPEPDSLMVWQPGTAGAVGHVGYVADVRNGNGAMQVKIYDRNWDGRPYDGQIYDRPRPSTDPWINLPSGARFIRVPPRFTPHNR